MKIFPKYFNSEPLTYKELLASETGNVTPFDSISLHKLLTLRVLPEESHLLSEIKTFKDITQIPFYNTIFSKLHFCFNLHTENVCQDFSFSKVMEVCPQW